VCVTLDEYTRREEEGRASNAILWRCFLNSLVLHYINVTRAKFYVLSLSLSLFSQKWTFHAERRLDAKHVPARGFLRPLPDQSRLKLTARR